MTFNEKKIMSPHRAIAFINIRFYVAAIALIGAPLLAGMQPTAQVLAEKLAEPRPVNSINVYSPEPMVCQGQPTADFSRSIEWRRSNTLPSI